MLCIPFDFETPFTWQSKKIRSWYFQCIEGQSLLILRITNFPCKSKKSIVTIKTSKKITEKTFIITIIMVHKILNNFKWPLKWLKRIGLKRLNSTPLQYKVVPKINFWRSKSKFNSCTNSSQLSLTFNWVCPSLNLFFSFHVWRNLSLFSVLKSDNLQYDMLVCWFVGANDSSTYLFFIISCKILCKKIFN